MVGTLIIVVPRKCQCSCSTLSFVYHRKIFMSKTLHLLIVFISSLSFWKFFFWFWFVHLFIQIKINRQYPTRIIKSQPYKDNIFIIRFTTSEYFDHWQQTKVNPMSMSKKKTVSALFKTSAVNESRFNVHRRISFKIIHKIFGSSFIALPTWWNINYRN